MKKFISFLRRLFRSLKGLAQKYVTPSVQIVEAIKKAVDSPATTLVTALIPGSIDDEIVSKIKQHLPRVLQVLRISEECLQLTAADEIVLCAINKLRTYNEEGRAAQYHNIAAMLSVSISDKRITWSEAVHLAEIIFQESKR